MDVLLHAGLHSPPAGCHLAAELPDIGLARAQHSPRAAPRGVPLSRSICIDPRVAPAGAAFFYPNRTPETTGGLLRGTTVLRFAKRFQHPGGATATSDRSSYIRTLPRPRLRCDRGSATRPN